MTDECLLDHCYFCGGAWGECICGWKHEWETDADTLFDTGEFAITAPNVSVCTRFYVAPVQYYGTPYVEWLASLSHSRRLSLFLVGRSAQVVPLHPL